MSERACDDAEAPANIRRCRPNRLPPCRYQCARGCVECTGHLDCVALSKLQHFFDGFLRVLDQLRYTPFWRNEVVQLNHRSGNFVPARVVKVLGDGKVSRSSMRAERTVRGTWSEPNTRLLVERNPKEGRSGDAQFAPPRVRSCLPRVA